MNAHPANSDQVPAAQPGQDAMLTPEDLAVRFRVAPRTIIEWTAAGDITGYRLGPRQQFRYTEADVQAYLQRNRVVPDRQVA